MAKAKTRRAISIKGTTYQRLENYADMVEAKTGERPSISGLLEGFIHDRLTFEQVPVPDTITCRPASRGRPKNPAEIEDDYDGHHFTW